MKKRLLSLMVVGFLTACAPQKEIVIEKVEVIKEVPVEKKCECVRYELPPDWKDPVKKEEKITNFSKYLEGKKIFIDPGHGGSDRHGKSQDGKIVEADVNLRISLFLQKYLEKAGAIVFMSRTDDSTVDLKYRSELANKSGADYFISVHHNAPGGKGDNWTNYTSVYYHATESDYEYDPCEKDLAKYIQRDLAYVMDNAGGLGSFDGTYSDYNIYPKDGFSVLRLTEISSVLIEGSFFTNTSEQQRLNDPVFNDIQAWGIFRGIGRYFAAGIPEVKYLKEKSKIKSRTMTLNFSVTDEKGIDKKSIQVFFDKEELQYNYNAKDGIITVTIEELEKGEHEVKVIVANKNGNHNLPFVQKVIYK